MSALKDISTIEKPPRIATLACDGRGYPIFFTAFVGSDGKPNFRIQDPYKWQVATERSLCGICGQKLGKRFAFVGGPKSMKSRYFTDAPMHESCAIYALQACPFIAMPRMAYLKHVQPGHELNHLVSDTKPELFGIGIATKMKLVHFQGQQLIKAGAWLRVRFWKDGSPV
ncbi:hypothetical protein ACI77O_12790 [Pseudomonas tritici]|uniref:hypothetical protein n=1 Tax=Pseudomonas tritici TaxID=2745518 RepID=UPI00387AD5B0